MPSSYKVIQFTEVDAVPVAIDLPTVYGGPGTLVTDLPANIDFARVWIEGGSCRWKNDGATPTVLSGVMLNQTIDPVQPLIVNRGHFGTFQIVQISDDAKLKVEFCFTG